MGVSLIPSEVRERCEGSVERTIVVWREETSQWLGINHRIRGLWLVRIAMRIETITAI
jgi:hypothetical protein